EKPISPSLAALLARRKDFAATAQSGGVEIIDGADGRVSYLSPIISEGDILGAVMSVMQNGMPPSEIEQKLIATGALFLGKQIEI
ncbi:MAG: stage V sporulation T C-terminal domain-containing protein, partial [Clostridia bacterium]